MINAKIIHDTLLKYPRYDFSHLKEIPFKNGIYVMFEKGESFCSKERITRIGTHKTDNRLISRLRQHVGKSKNASIFLKNVGLSLLAKENSPYVDTYAVNTSNKKVIETLSGYNSEIEMDITTRSADYIQSNFSFICIPVEEKTERLRLEEALISTLCHDQEFTDSISSAWLGLYSPKKVIRESGLWVSQGVNAAPITDEEFEKIESGLRK